MSAVSQPVFTPVEQYLINENDNPSGIRHEYVNGLVYAMAGASRGHNRVTNKLALRLGIHLQDTPCEVFQSDMKVGIRQQNDVRFYYPDVQVTCAEETETYYNTAPCLVIEVLSESTARKDRTEKLMGYQLLNSLQEYLICSQDTPIVELYRRRTYWQRERFTDNQSFILESVDLEMVVNDLYDFLLKD